MGVALTVAEAVTLLDPPMTERQLRAFVRELGWQPVSSRRSGRRGHPVAAYDSAQIFKLHAALAPWLGFQRA